MPKHSPWQGPRNICGPRIRQARRELGLTQQELVIALQILGTDVDRRLLSHIEHQQRPVRDLELRAFSRALRKPISWLMEEE